MKILLAAKHSLFRAAMRSLLEDLLAGGAVTEAGTVDEMTVGLRAGERFDLILMDPAMPDWMSGEAIAKVRGFQPDARVVVVADSEEKADVRAALEKGAAGYLPKSSSSKVMRGAIDLVLSGGVYIPPSVLLAPVTQPRPEGASDKRLRVALTGRQKQVLAKLNEGKSNKQIANELGLTEGTVKIHVGAIFKSLGVKNRTHAVMAARAAA